MRKVWSYRNDNGEKAQVVYFGGVTMAFMHDDSYRFPSPKSARLTMEAWGYQEIVADKIKNDMEAGHTEAAK